MTYWRCLAFDVYSKTEISVCVCTPILVVTFPNWLSGTEPLPHIRCRESILVVFVVFRVHMHSFAGLIRRTPPPTFSDTAITDHHFDTTIFQLRAHWVRADILVYWIRKIVRTCAASRNRTLDSLHKGLNTLSIRVLAVHAGN